MNLSADQRDRILRLLGSIEAERRGINLWNIDRLDASGLIHALEREADAHGDLHPTVVAVATLEGIADDLTRALTRIGSVTSELSGTPAPASDTTTPTRTGPGRRRRGSQQRLAATITSRGWAMRSDPSHPDHGTASGYGSGCRCDRCTDANRDKLRASRRKHTT